MLKLSMMKGVIISALFIFVISLILYANYEKNYDVKLRVSDNSFMDNVSIIQRRDGIVKLSVNAEKAVFILDDEVQLNRLTMTIPEKGLTLSSSSGLYNLKTKDLKMVGDIKAYTKDFEIFAENLLWDSSRNEVTSDKRIRIVGKNFSAEGNSFEAIADKATLKENVKAIFYGK
jgi:LPS export ABC transporter protein LptC